MLRWVPLCLLGCVDEGGSQSEGADVSTNETQICLETMTEVGMDESVFGFSSLADTVASVEVSGSVEAVTKMEEQQWCFSRPALMVA